MTDVASYLARHRDAHLGELQELLRIPSISTDSRNVKDVRRAADWVGKRLKTAGCTRVKVHSTSRHPIVYGEWLGAKGAPTILVYGHYDVQPVDPLTLWDDPPFEPTVRDGNIYARGASDDKGQVLTHIHAFEAHMKAHGTCPLNVKFLIEGEEEIGSPNLEPFILQNKSKLACDAVVVSDTAMFGNGVPTICYGLRGLTYLEVKVTGTNRDLHSGCFGGAVVNPANALVEMLASMKDAKGKVKIPAFYDGVRRIGAAERRALAALRHSDRKFKTDIGAPGLHGESGYTTLERLWCRPTVDVNGIWSGFTGEGAKTVIPAEAHAKISMRLVPDQGSKSIARKVTAHLRKVAPKSVKVSVMEHHGGEPWLAPTDDPALQAGRNALERAFGKKSVLVREGGSIPVVATFDKVLKVPTVLMGFGLNDDNLHAPNEKMNLENFFGGIRASAFLMEELGNSAGAKSPGAGSKKRR